MGGGDLDSWIASIRKCELLPEHDLKHLCEYVQELMLEESTVHPVQSPVTICGDIHGQFHDLLELFQIAGQVRIASLQETRQWGSAQGRRMTATRGTPTKPT